MMLRNLVANEFCDVSKNRRAEIYRRLGHVISAGHEVLSDRVLPTGDSKNNNNLILRKCGLRGLAAALDNVLIKYNIFESFISP